MRSTREFISLMNFVLSFRDLSKCTFEYFHITEPSQFTQYCGNKKQKLGYTHYKDSCSKILFQTRTWSMACRPHTGIYRVSCLCKWNRYVQCTMSTNRNSIIFVKVKIKPHLGQTGPHCRRLHRFL